MQYAKQHFISYGDDNFANSKKRIHEEAKNMGVFESVDVYGPEFISKDFKSKFEYVFKHSKGAGYWIWKYYIISEKLKELNGIWDETEFSRFWKNHGIEKITARTGIHTGSVIAGNIGSDRMLQYSTIGDTVNVASRLEQANKDFESDIAFSHEIYNALNQKLHSKAIFLGEIKLKGREKATKVYSV